MRLLNQRSPARLKRIDRQSIRALVYVLSLSLICLAGCTGAGGTSGTNWFSDFFSAASPTPTESIEPIPTATPTPLASPVAEETPGHLSKKTARQTRAASENAAIASRAAASASAAAAQSSKQAASVANRIEGSEPTNADVSLESNPAAAGASEGAIGNRATPASRPSLAVADPTGSSAARTVSTPALESAGSSGDSAKAAKLIQDVDKMQRRIDRKNLSGDDSQRDILAQKLLQQASKALADRDSVAAISLATKASTLFAPLPKLADSVTPPAL